MDPNEDPREGLERLAERALELAQRAGAEAAAASVGLSQQHKVMIRDGITEELKSSVSRGLSLRVYVDGRFGSHGTSDLRDEAIERFVGEAVDLTRLLMPDEHRGLAEPALYEGRSTADLGLYDPSHTEVSPEARKERATRAHDAARRAAGEVLLSADGVASDSVGYSVLRTTNGFADDDRSTAFAVTASVSALDASGRRPSGWASAADRHRGMELDPEAIGTEAAERARAQLGATDIPSLTVPIIVENRTAGRLLGGFLGPLSGGAIDQKRSCFADQMGEAIASEKLTIIDEPFILGGWGSQRYDGEGLTARRNHVIEAGVLRRFFLSTYFARKLKMDVTGGGSANLVFEHGTRDLDALCQKAGKAILITGFLGGNSNGTTGDFSHGLRGFLIENGVRSRPIASMNIAQNHTTFWKQLEELGNDPYVLSSRRTPSLLFGPTLIAGR